jgi:hypothetical protein
MKNKKNYYIQNQPSILKVSMGQTKNHMSTFDETQYWGPWGGSEVGAGAKKRRKK